MSLTVAEANWNPYMEKINPLFAHTVGHHGYTSSGTGLNADTSQNRSDVFEFACVFLACQCGTSAVVTGGPCGGQTDR